MNAEPVSGETAARSAMREALTGGGDRFAFFQAVTLIERMLEAPVSVGDAGPPAREVIRFTADPGMGFPAGDLNSIIAKTSYDAAGDEEFRYLLEVTFMGLYGPASPLPLHVTELITDNSTDSDALRGFLDVFNNRLIGLLYRVWRRYRHHQVFDKQHKDEITRLLASLVGGLDLLDHDDAYSHDGDSLRAVFSNAASFGLYCHSASVLEKVLESALPGIDVQVEEWVMRHATIVEEQRFRLGRDNATLGEDALLGEKTPDVTGKFRIWIGPLTLDSYIELLPGSPLRASVDRLVKRVLRDHLIHDIVLIVDEEEAPAWKLGATARGMGRGTTLALGRTTWLGTPEHEDRAVAFVGGR